MTTLASLLVQLGIDAKGFHEGVKGVESSAGSLLGVLGKVAVPAAFGAAIVGAGKMAWDAGMTMDSAMDTIATKTGATGARLDALGADFEAVFKSIPTDADTAAGAMSELSTRLNITGTDLQNLSRPLLEVSRLTGGDATNNAALYARVMGDWGIPVAEGADKLDMLFTVSQKTGVGMESLMQKVVQFGSPLRLMGFSLEDSAALFGKWEAEGVNAELVMGSLRIAAGKFAKEGVPLRESLMGTFEAIQNNTDASEALALGMEVFGARAGPDMVAAIREGRFSIDELAAAMENSEGAIMATADATADFPEKMQKLKNSLTTTLAPLGLMMMDALTGAVEAAAPAIETMIEWLGTNIPVAVDYLATAWTGTLLPAIQTVAGFIDPVITMFELLGSAITGNKVPVSEYVDKFVFLQQVLGTDVTRAFNKVLMAITNLAADFRAFVSGTLVPALQTLLEWLKTNIPPAIAALSAAWQNVLLPAIRAVAAFISTQVVPALQTIFTWLVTNLPPAIAALSAAWQTTLLPAIQAVAAFIGTEVVPVLQTIFTWLGTNLPPAITALSELWSTVLLPALTVVAGFIQTNVVPILQTLGTWLQTNIPPAIAALTAAWNTVLLPALTAVWNFISTKLIPLFKGIVEVEFALLKLALTALTGIWQNVLLPALRNVWKFIQEKILPVFGSATDEVNTKLGPALTWLKDNVLGPLEKAFGGIGQAIDGVIGWLGKMGNTIGGLGDKLPSWMRPGSPTPLEIGLWGIRDALRAVAGTDVPLFGAQPQLALAPAYAGAGVRGAAGAGGVTNHYAFQVSVHAPGGEPQAVAAATEDGVTRAGRALGLW